MYKVQAQIVTSKAPRHLKAICNHFHRQVPTEYKLFQGMVKFSFGNCLLVATDSALGIRLLADNEENLNRVQFVINDYLIRSGNNELLDVIWIDE